MPGTSKPGTHRPEAAQALAALQEMLASGSVRCGAAADAVCGVVPQLYVEPGDEAELSRVLRYANESELLVSPRGGGSKLAWGTAPEAIDLMVSTARFNRILEYAPGDMTVTVGAGVTIAELQRALAGHGQRLALDPLWPERATVGGVIATNDSGALRLRYGSIRDLIIGITVVLADGTIAVSGGKVVKNVAGYDLPKLIAGSLGTLGVIARAVFRLHPQPESSATLSWTFPDCNAANQFMLAIADSLTVPTGLQMRCSAAGEVQADVRFEGIAAGIEAQFASVRKLAGDVEAAMPPGDPWRAREQLWPGTEFAGAPLLPSDGRGGNEAILKLSVLPTRLAATAETVGRMLGDAGWKLLMYSTGLGWLRVDSARGDSTDAARTAEFVTALRAALAPEAGTAVLLQAPAEVRAKVNVWGQAGSALGLMRSIKQHFDRNRILNRARFVGGI